jgi:hypothetical protein
METQIITVEDRRNELLNSLMPGLRDYVNLFVVKEDTLKLLSELPQGGMSFLHGDLKNFGENKYVRDFLDKMIYPKSQYQIYSILKMLADKFNVSEKKILISYHPELKKALWFDCRIAKYSLYVGSVDIDAKESTYFVSGNFFPDKI